MLVSVVRGRVVSLRHVTVQSVRTIEERPRRDALATRHHDFPLNDLFGSKSLRRVPVHGGNRLALAGWQAGAFTVGVRDR